MTDGTRIEFCSTALPVGRATSCMLEAQRTGGTLSQFVEPTWEPLPWPLPWSTARDPRASEEWWTREDGSIRQASLLPPHGGGHLGDPAIDADRIAKPAIWHWAIALSLTLINFSTILLRAMHAHRELEQMAPD